MVFIFLFPEKRKTSNFAKTIKCKMIIKGYNKISQSQKKKTLVKRIIKRNRVDSLFRLQRKQKCLK